MNIETYFPCDALRSYVKRYTIIDCAEEVLTRALPETSQVLAIRFKGLVRQQTGPVSNDLPTSMVSGLRKSGRLMQYLKNSGNILVIFNEMGARSFFHEPLYEIFDTSVSLDNFEGYQQSELLHEQLDDANENVERVRIVETFLMAKLLRYKPDALVYAALEKIRIAKGIIKMKALADALCISQDAFEKRFRKLVGVSPKQYSYIVRMKAILGTGLHKQSLSDVAFQSGYYDQPHFTKDFKLFTGQTPTEYLKSPIIW